MGPTRYVPLDMPSAAWPQHRLRHLLVRGGPLHLTDVLLAGLVMATGMTTLVLWFTTTLSEE